MAASVAALVILEAVGMAALVDPAAP